jgi:glycosyltransferase involved in cell wall biosynthesis
MKCSVSVVIPTYMNSHGLAVLIPRLVAVLENVTASWEVILVDDCSFDSTWQHIQQLSKQYRGVRGIQLSRNVGQAIATLCGIRATSGEIVITMDDDLQHAPEAIPGLISKLIQDDLDAIFAWFPVKHHSWLRNLGSRLNQYLNARATGLRDLKTSSFRLIRKNIADFIRASNSFVGTPTTMILHATKHVKSVPTDHQYRTVGHSKYSLIRAIRLGVKNIFLLSLIPIETIFWIGIVLALLAGLFIVSIIVRYLLAGFDVPGWATIIVLITFFNAIILISLSTIGVYVARLSRSAHFHDFPIIRRETGF